MRAGVPAMMAHLCLDFPQDESALSCQDEYMLGRGLLVAPIVREGAMERGGLPAQRKVD